MPHIGPRAPLLARVALLSVLVLPAGCAADEPGAGRGGVQDASGFAALQSDLRARGEAPDRTAVWFRVIEELLPNTSYAVEEEPPAPLTDCVVSGDVLAVERGVGNKREKRDTWVATTFDDPTARNRTLHVTLAVEHEIGSVGCDASADSGATVQFGLAIGPDVTFDDAEAGLRAMDTVVVFLAPSAVFADDPLVHGVVLDGGMIADVNETDGSLSLPFLGADRARGLLATTSSLEELEAAGREPGSIIAIRRDGDRLVR